MDEELLGSGGLPVRRVKHWRYCEKGCGCLKTESIVLRSVFYYGFGRSVVVTDYFIILFVLRK